MMWHRLVAWWRGWRYHWAQDRADVLDGPVAEYWAEVGGRDFYGSMSLEEEPYPLPWPRQEGDWLPAPPGHEFVWREPDWREQTAADLSPEALEALDDWDRGEPVLVIPCDSGPGDPPSSASAPGPDLTRLADTGDIAAAHEAHPHPGDGWLDAQLADLFAWVRAQYAGSLA